MVSTLYESISTSRASQDLQPSPTKSLAMETWTTCSFTWQIMRSTNSTTIFSKIINRLKMKDLIMGIMMMTMMTMEMRKKDIREVLRLFWKYCCRKARTRIRLWRRSKISWLRPLLGDNRTWITCIVYASLSALTTLWHFKFWASILWLTKIFDHGWSK